MSVYHYTECGLPNIFLANGYTIHENDKYGPGLIIDDIKGLHRAIGLDVVTKPGRLNGREIRFLRHEMNMSQKSLGLTLDKAEITVRKWEASDSNIDKSSDRLLRVIYTDFVNGGRALDLINRLNELDKAMQEQARKVFEKVVETDEGWHRKAA